IAKGKLYSPEEARKLGLVDGVAPRDKLLELARKKLGDGKRKLEERTIVGSSRRDDRTPQRGVPTSGAGNAAPELAGEIINKTLSISPDQSLRMELDAIVDLGKSESTQNLIRNFFLAEKYKKGI